MVSTIAPSLRRRALLIGLVVLASAGTARAQSIGDLLSPPQSLEAMALRIERAFPRVRQAPPAVVAQFLASPSAFLLLDVRERDEFDVSHVPGAERLSPHASQSQALAQIDARAGDRVVIFYCSVGQRSSRMADQIGPALRGRGARDIYNLRGGVFAWHNEARPLVDGFGPTPYVHPFSAAWGRLLSRPDLARTQPRSRP